MKVKQKMVGRYRLEHTLGEGSFAKVKQAVDTTTGERVAIKILALDNSNKKALRRIKTEVCLCPRP